MRGNRSERLCGRSSVRRLRFVTVLCYLVGTAFVVNGCSGGEGDTPTKNATQTSSTSRPLPPATYVGRTVCAECHDEQTRLWQRSHHYLAMQEVSEDTVLGDFSNVTLTHFSVTSRFYKKGGGYYVETEGPDGDMTEHRIAYAFGFFPLQQYLIEFSNGRYQTLPLCWDSRSAEEGGQRWFHVYPDERIAPHDELYWTGPMQNWNLQCAECHSTNLAKNYDVQTGTYDTTFDEINVSCEACHGPGSNHAAWARTEPNQKEHTADDDFRLAVRLKEPQLAAWINDPETGQPKRTTPLQSQVQLDVCARCHSRRGALTADYTPGTSLLQTHQPALLEPPLYHADGQIEDEVYVWGSFLQSRMFANDVRCVDCHEPHSLELVKPLQQLCIGCHLGEKYTVPDHHFHEMGTPGSACVDCHMPQRTYMEVDARRDHSFRVPRPDLSVALGIPNTCNGCHDDRSARWAADACVEWYGPPADDPPSAAPAIHAAAFNRAGADAMLIEVIQNEAQSAILRATALAMLRNQPSEGALETIRQQVLAHDPLLRLAAARALAPYPHDLRWTVGAVLLDDDVRAVRIEAARVLAAGFGAYARGDRDLAFKRALKELWTSLAINADRPSTIVDQGNLHRELGNVEEAQLAYRTALNMQPNNVIASVNLADLYRDLGREDQVLGVLREALRHSPNEAALYYSRGLAQARGGDIDNAVESLVRAYEIAPTSAQYAYAYAIALNSTSRGDEAISVLKQASQENPGHRDVLYALATVARDRGRFNLAIAAAEQLIQLAPHDEQYRALLESLR